MTFNDLDGTFTHRCPGELRRWDVLFDPPCQVLDEPSATVAGTVAVRTSAGERRFGTDEPVWAFRPANADVACEECGADPGVPCNPTTCCALAMLKDAAEAAREDR